MQGFSDKGRRPSVVFGELGWWKGVVEVLGEGLEERGWVLGQKWRPGAQNRVLEDADARPGEAFSPKRNCLFLLHWKRYIFYSKYYFEDPNGQKLPICVRNLLLKFQDDPTVNESGTWILPTQVLEKNSKSHSLLPIKQTPHILTSTPSNCTNKRSYNI